MFCSLLTGPNSIGPATKALQFLRQQCDNFLNAVRGIIRTADTQTERQRWSLLNMQREANPHQAQTNHSLLSVLDEPALGDDCHAFFPPLEIKNKSGLMFDLTGIT